MFFQLGIFMKGMKKCKQFKNTANKSFPFKKKLKDYKML